MKRLKENLTNILLIIVVIVCTCVLYVQNRNNHDDIKWYLENMPQENYKYLILEWTLDNDLMQIMKKLDE